MEKKTPKQHVNLSRRTPLTQVLKLSSQESMDQDKTYRPRQNLQKIPQTIYSEYDMKQCNNELHMYMLPLIKK